MSQMTPKVSKLLEHALSLSVEEQEALADSLISNLGGKVDEGSVAAWAGGPFKPSFGLSGAVQI